MSIIRDFQGYIKNKQLGCYVISREPLIITSYWHDFLQNRASLYNVVPADKPVWIIFQIGYYKSEEASKEIQQIISEITQEHPNLNFWFLNNSIEEDERFAGLGLNTRFINQNAFLDEERYHVLDRSYQYDAIYLARFTPVKRHYLAEKVNKLLLIGSYKSSEAEYYHQSREILKQAVYKEKVWGTQVSNYMNMAQVGLCLSDLEGAMFVSTEYLLSGLPVVSTPSLGGRDIYYDETNSILVEPEAEAVGEAVYRLIDIKPDRNGIRRRTIQKINQHRSKFIDLIQEIYDITETSRQFKTEWPEIFIHKMGLRSRIPFNKYRSHILRDHLSLKTQK